MDKKYNLLIVDDDPVSQDIMAKVLSSEGYHVTIARDGKEAIEYVQRMVFNLILLDIEMPNMNGIEVLRAIRKKYNPDERPIMMVTCRDERDDMLEAFNIGANDYIVKPLDIKVVLARIRSHLGLSKTKES